MGISDSKLQDIEYKLNDVIIKRESERKDVIDPLVQTVGKHSEKILRLESLPPQKCQKLEEWKAADAKMAALVKLSVEHGGRLAVVETKSETLVKTVTRDVEWGIKMKEKLEGLEEDVGDVKVARKTSFWTLVAVIAGFVATMAGGVFFLGSLTERIALYDQNRREDATRVNTRISRVESKLMDPNQPVAKQVESLALAVKSQTPPTLLPCLEVLSQQQRRLLLNGEEVVDLPEECVSPSSEDVEIPNP